jgi:hypothetical protein
VGGQLCFGVVEFMTRFTWDQVDVLTCLEVEPEVDEDSVSLHYELSRNGWEIELTIFPADRDLHLVLRQEGLKEPFIDFWMRDIGEIRYLRRDAVEELVFLSSNEQDDRPNLPFGFALRVSPEVGLLLGDSFGGGLTSRRS